MLLAVAGLKPEEVKAVTKRLASGDWSGFPKAEQAAFGLAYKLSKEPWAITDKDRAVRGQAVEALAELGPAAQGVSGALTAVLKDPDRIELVQDIEFGHAHAGNAVELIRTPLDHGVEPSTAALAAGVDADLLADGRQVPADVVVQFGRERPLADAGGVGLDDAQHIARPLRPLARTGRGRTVVRISGELDMAALVGFDEMLVDVLADGRREVIFDLRPLEFIDSSGITALLRADKRLM